MAFNPGPFPKDWCGLHLHILPSLAACGWERESRFSAGNHCSVSFVCWFFFFFFGYAALWDSKAPHDLTYERVCYCAETSPPSQLPSQEGSLSPNPLSPFLSLYFVLPHSEEIDFPFWVSGIFCQHSEIVLWKLLHIQIIIWCFYGRENGLPILFLFYRGSTLQKFFLLYY